MVFQIGIFIIFVNIFQYYATVDAGDLNPSGDNIMWLGVDNIEERDTRVIADVPDMVGSGQSVGKNFIQPNPITQMTELF